MLLRFLLRDVNVELIFLAVSVDTVRNTLEHCEIMRNAILMQLGNFIDVFLARHVSGEYAHHQEH